MKHALITGAAGFIGSHLVDRLLAEGWRVTGVDNFDPYYPAEMKRSNLIQATESKHFRLVELDLCHRQPAFDALTGPFDVVVHLAARPGVRTSVEHPDQTQLINTLSTQTALDLARAQEIPQFVFASSSSVYGVNPMVPWQEEQAVLMPISPYAATKVAGELMGHVYSHLYGLRFIALRFFTVFGPRQRPDLAIRKFALCMQRGEAVPVFGDGTPARDFTYIQDILDGLCAAIDYKQTPYEVINLGNDRVITVLQMVSVLERALGVKARRSHQPMQPGDVPITRACIQRAGRLLGYRPRTDFATGIEKFVEWMRAR